MNPEVGGELLRVIAAARGWLEELHEDGLEVLPEPARESDTRPLEAAAARPLQPALLGRDEPSWGEAPTLQAVSEVLYTRRPAAPTPVDAEVLTEGEP